MLPSSFGVALRDSKCMCGFVKNTLISGLFLTIFSSLAIRLSTFYRFRSTSISVSDMKLLGSRGTRSNKSASFFLFIPLSSFASPAIRLLLQLRFGPSRAGRGADLENRYRPKLRTEFATCRTPVTVPTKEVCTNRDCKPRREHVRTERLPQRMYLPPLKGNRQ